MKIDLLERPLRVDSLESRKHNSKTSFVSLNATRSFITG